MTWENSRALTPLKRDFLKAFFGQPQAFFLTGGSALGVFYLQHRLSYDLDFFTTDRELQWHVLDNDLRAIAQSIEAECKSITASPTFRRYELNRGADREMVDFVLEMVPQLDGEKERFGRVCVDTLREIMVNKICTLVGRCEVKDLLDLYFLDKRGMHVVDHLHDARKKEGGLEPAMISFLLDSVRIDAIPDYVLEPVNLEDFEAFIAALKQKLADMAFPEA